MPTLTSSILVRGGPATWFLGFSRCGVDTVYAPFRSEQGIRDGVRFFNGWSGEGS